MIDNCNEYYKLKILSWEFYYEDNFKLAQTIAKRLVYITKKKGDFPGSSGLLANANTILGLVVIDNDAKLACSYLLKTANHPVFNDKRSQKLMLLAQYLLDKGEKHTVQTFLKKKIYYMKCLETPNILTSQVDGIIVKMENLVKEINHGKVPNLIMAL